MLQRHLVPYTTALDEHAYQVVFRDQLDRSANRGFSETGVLAAPWLEDSYRRGFRAKLNAAGFRVPRGGRVLDACCGFGYLGRFIAGEYGATVTFCDLSLTQLTGLRERLPEQVRRETVAADVTSLPYGAGTFDAVVGNSFLHHLPDVPRALAEFHRVLRPGGVLVLLHEPSTSAAYWESFPVSAFRDTTPVDGFADLWAFSADDLLRLAHTAQFGSARVYGTGAVNAVLLNWLLILGLKLNWQHPTLLAPAYTLRTWLLRLEGHLPRPVKPSSPPSLMLYAVRQ